MRINNRFDKIPKIADKNVMRSIYDCMCEFEAESLINHRYFDPYMPVAPTHTLKSKATGDNWDKSKIPDIVSKIEKGDLSFFDKEIPMNLILDQIVQVSNKPLSLRVCFALAVRSLSTLIQFIMSKQYDPNETQYFSKISRLIDSLPLPLNFAPSFKIHYILNYGLPTFKLASPTALCAYKNSVFMGTDHQEIYEYSSKGVNFFYKLPSSFTDYSLIVINEHILVISPNSAPAIINLSNKNTLTLRAVSKGIPQSISAPCITDTKFVYSYDNGTVKVYEQENDLLVHVRTVKLNGKCPKRIHQCAIATNGTFISFANTKKKHARVFSLISGKRVGKAQCDGAIWGWAYDARMNGHWVVNGDGLILYENYSCLPFWTIDYSLTGTSSIAGLLSMYFIHFIGCGSDIPMSCNDPTVIPAILSFLESEIISKGIRSIPLMNAFLVALQIKMRTTNDFKNLPYVSIYRTLMNCFELQELRRHVCFIFLSCITIFTKVWTAECSYILERIIDETSCHDLVFTYIQGAVFPINLVTPNIINKLASLCLKTDIYSDKSIILLSNLQKQLFNEFEKSQKIFIPYSATVFTLFTEKTIFFYAGQITEEEFLSSNEFILLKRLILLMYKNLNVVSSSISTFEQLFLLSLMKAKAPGSAPKALLDLFDNILFLALSLSIRKINGEMSFIDFPDGPRPDENIIREIAKNYEAPEEKIQQLLSISKQPLRKMKFFLSGKSEFATIKANESAIIVFLDLIQWFNNFQQGNFKIIFTFFTVPFKNICADFFCLPQKLLSNFARYCPVFLLLPKQFVSASGFEIELQNVLSFKHCEIVEYFPNLLLTTKNLNAIDLANPLLGIQYLMVPNEVSLHRVLLLCQLALNAKDADKLPDLLPALKKVLKLASQRVIEAMTSICEVCLQLQIINPEELFVFIFETIGLSFRNQRVFLNIRDQITKMELTMQLSSFLRKLLVDNDENLLSFISEKINSFNDAQQIALFVITSKELNNELISANIFTNLEEINTFFQNAFPCNDPVKHCLLLSSTNFFAENEKFVLPTKLGLTSFYNQYNPQTIMIQLLTEVTQGPTNTSFDFVSRLSASRSRVTQGVVEGSFRAESDPLRFFSSPIHCDVEQTITIKNEGQKHVGIQLISIFSGKVEICSNMLEVNKSEIRIEFDPKNAIVLICGIEFQLFPSAEKNVVSLSLVPQTYLTYTYEVTNEHVPCKFIKYSSVPPIETQKIPSKLPRSSLFESKVLHTIEERCEKAFAFSIFASRRLNSNEEKTMYTYEKLVSSVFDPFGEIRPVEINQFVIQPLIKILEDQISKEENHFIWPTNKTAIPYSSGSIDNINEFFIMPLEFKIPLQEKEYPHSFLIPKTNFRETGIETFAFARVLYTSVKLVSDEFIQIKEIIMSANEKGSPAFITTDLSNIL